MSDTEASRTKRIMTDSEDESDSGVKQPAPLNELFDDDEEEEQQESNNEEDVDAGLFGEEEEDDDRRGNTNFGEDNEDDEEELEEREETLMELSLTRFPPSHKPSKDSYFVPVPNFFSVDPHAFNASAFLKSAEDGHTDDVKQSQFHKLRNMNTIRWKFSRNERGEMIKESNSRFVKWSDGSVSLQLGNEMFDIIEKPTPDVFLAMSHHAQEVLQTTAALNKSMAFVPTSTSSETHKRLREELHVQQENKTIAVGNVATIDDPEKLKRDAVKAEELTMKARKKLEQKKRNLEDRHDAGNSRASRLGSSNYDSYDGGHRGRDEYEEDDFVVEDEDEDEEENRAKRLKDLKRKGAEKYRSSRDFDDDDEDDLDDEIQDDEEEEEEAEFTDNEEEDQSRRRTKRRIMDDDDDE